MNVRALLAAGSVTLAALAAGCGDSKSPSVPNIGTTNVPTTTVGKRSATAGSPQGSTGATALQYSQCMRANGIRDFPDPDSKGEISLSDQPGSDLNPSNPALQAALRSCRAKITFFKANPTSAENAQATAELLQFARCVRAHGVPNFPDPSSLGPNEGVGFLIDRNTLDPHRPGLQAAIAACQSAARVSPGIKSYG